MKILRLVLALTRKKFPDLIVQTRIELYHGCYYRYNAALSQLLAKKFTKTFNGQEENFREKCERVRKSINTL